MRWFGKPRGWKLWIIGLVFWTGGLVPSLAGIAPGSLRVAKTQTDVHLSWQAGSGPYGIYRSPRPDDILRPAWLAGATLETFFDDPLGEITPGLHFYLVDDPQPCASIADCDDLISCNGQETCSETERRCMPGAPVSCNDGDACTTDTCDEEAGGCLYSSLDCDDGDPCTLDECQAQVGCSYRVDPAAGRGSPAQLAGGSLPAFPDFEFSRSFNQAAEIDAGVDPVAHEDLVGQTCDLYIVEARSASEWCAGGGLSDVRGAPQAVTIASGGIEDNTFVLSGGETLSAEAGTGIGHGYDLVLDCDRDGFAGSGELVDGLEDESGFYVVDDITQGGPLTVSTFEDLGPEPPHCSGGGNDDMRVYYPSELDDPEFVGTFPLAVISHGNGHCYDWYDFLGEHLASYGFIVMAHDNNTGPGIETASTTTLEFTDKIIGEQGTLGGGVLDGHIDSRRIAWIGHSRGGEGVARAYDRLVDEGYPAANYTADDIVVVSSIAPTDFLGPDQSDPHDVPYHLLYGSADGDVCGCPNNAVTDAFSVYERARGPRQATYIHGADHNDFNCCGGNDFTGPPETEIGRPEAQQVQKAALLALLELFVKGQLAAKDYLWRQYESFRPLGVAASTVVVNELREAPAQRELVVDDYQTEPDVGISSSGGNVSASVADLVEERLRDTDSSFEWTGTEPMNGMTRGRAEDVGRGAVFDYTAGGEAFYEFELPPGARDVSAAEYLSFRACQGTRHPETVAVLEDLIFTVTLADDAGQSSSIGIGVYGGGIEEPYQRGGFGAGSGWQNEFETIRIRLDDFQRNGQALDLQNLRSVRFEFGSVHGSPEGRLAFDDIEFVKE